MFSNASLTFLLGLLVLTPAIAGPSRWRILGRDSETPEILDINEAINEIVETGNSDAEVNSEAVEEPVAGSDGDESIGSDAESSLTTGDAIEDENVDAEPSAADDTEVVDADAEPSSNDDDTDDSESSEEAVPKLEYACRFSLLIYAPTCASNGKIYASPYELLCAQVKDPSIVNVKCGEGTERLFRSIL